MKREMTTVWICECNHKDVRYDQCNPKNPFKALARGKVAEHERNHRALIKRHEELIVMVANTQNIITPELRVGTWDDWKGILEATKRFSKFAHEHQGIYRRSFFIQGASDDLEKAVRMLLWYQTKEGEVVSGERWMKQVFTVLRAMFDNIKLHGERKRCPKKSFNSRMATAEKLLQGVLKKAEAIEKKFPKAEGLKDVLMAIEVCRRQMKKELRQSHKEDP